MYSTQVLQAKFEEADSLLASAIDTQEKILGPDHPTLAMSLDARANILQIQVWELSRKAGLLFDETIWLLRVPLASVGRQK